MASQLTLVVVAKDEGGFVAGVHSLFDAAVHIVPVANRSRESLASIGNRFLDLSESPVFGLCHADCGFGPGALETFTETALAGAVCGIVGIDINRTYRWAKNPGEPGPVSTLDSCSVFFRKDSGLQFDAALFDGLHCHVEDLCLQAQQKGIPVVVPEAQATHEGASTFQPAWQAEYWAYRGRLAQKWPGVRFETT